MEHDVTTLRAKTKELTSGLAFKNETRKHLGTRSQEGWELVSTHLLPTGDHVDVVMFWKRNSAPGHQPAEGRGGTL